MKTLTVFSADLGLRNDQLQRVAVVGAGNRVVEDADRLKEIASDGRFAREVRRVCQDLLALCGELHAVALLAALLHGSLDTGDFVSGVHDLLDFGVEHIRASIDGRKTGETLW